MPSTKQTTTEYRFAGPSRNRNYENRIEFMRIEFMRKETSNELNKLAYKHRRKNYEKGQLRPASRTYL